MAAGSYDILSCVTFFPNLGGGGGGSCFIWVKEWFTINGILLDVLSYILIRVCAIESYERMRLFIISIFQYRNDQNHI